MSRPRGSAPDPRLEIAWTRSGSHAPRGEPEECILAPAAAAAGAGGIALNRVGAWIWERLDGSADGSALVDALTIEFDLERGRAERDYLELVGRLAELGAIRPMRPAEPD